LTGNSRGCTILNETMIKKAILLVGGEGKRLRPLTLKTPKPLILIHKKPIITHIVDFLLGNNVSEIALVANAKHKGSFDEWKVQYQTETPSPANIDIYYESEPQGTFGYVRNLKDWINGEKFILANGDCLINFDIRGLEEFHVKNKPVTTIALLKSDYADAAKVMLEEAAVVAMGRDLRPKHEDSGFVVSGFYVIEPNIFDYDDPSRRFVNIENEILENLIKARKVIALKIENSRFFDCGTMENLEKAVKEW
jgi:NDP-sugar pyrophosphorylase family protein